MNWVDAVSMIFLVPPHKWNWRECEHAAHLRENQWRRAGDFADQLGDLPGSPCQTRRTQLHDKQRTKTQGNCWWPIDPTSCVYINEAATQSLWPEKNKTQTRRGRMGTCWLDMISSNDSVPFVSA